MPVIYRKLIVDSAHTCVQPDVSPALIAAMLKVESDFDPDLSDPAADEFGIARWTPGAALLPPRCPTTARRRRPSPARRSRRPRPSRPWAAICAPSRCG
ncbi:hypothetical protein NKH77_22810 [Streptomyces sp. M19]